MSLFFLLPTGTDMGTVTLTGDTTTETDTPSGDLICGIEVRTDGTVYRITGDTGGGGPVYNQSNSSTDWIIPNAASIKRTFHVKMDKNSGDTLNVGSAAEGSWIELTDTKSWWLEASTDQDYNGTLSISDDGGSTTLSSNTYIFDLNVI
jgi:hypothetical protein